MNKNQDISDLYDQFLISYKTGNFEEAWKSIQKLFTTVTATPAGVADEAFRQHLEYNVGFLTDKIAPYVKLPSVAIVCYENPAVGQWSPFSVSEGIAGSEEAVIHCAQILANRGYRVVVYADPPRSAWPYTSDLSNPQYVHAATYGHAEYDFAIAWRRTDFEDLLHYAKKVYFWPHDVCNGIFNIGKTPDNKNIEFFISGCFWLSEYHKKGFEDRIPLLSNIPYVISGNGICLKDFGIETKNNSLNHQTEDDVCEVEMEGFSWPQSDTKRANPFSCGYYSNYGRGLSSLLDIWLDVRMKYPKATLDIFYGKQTWGTISDEELQKMMNKIKSFAKRGVREHGKVSHAALAAHMSKTSLWVYPCNTKAETFCITAIKTQAAGMIPVVIPEGALKETVSGKGYRTKAQPSEKRPNEDEATTSVESDHVSEGDDDHNTSPNFKDLLLKAFNDIETNKAPDRQIFRDFATKFTWERTVDKWLEIMK